MIVLNLLYVLYGEKSRAAPYLALFFVVPFSLSVNGNETVGVWPLLVRQHTTRPPKSKCHISPPHVCSCFCVRAILVWRWYLALYRLTPFGGNNKDKWVFLSLPPMYKQSSQAGVPSSVHVSMHCCCFLLCLKRSSPSSS